MCLQRLSVSYIFGGFCVSVEFCVVCVSAGSGLSPLIATSCTWHEEEEGVLEHKMVVKMVVPGSGRKKRRSGLVQMRRERLNSTSPTHSSSSQSLLSWKSRTCL